MNGRVVSHYELIHLLGKGAMGSVHKAHDVKLDRDVAIKFIAPGFADDERQKSRFIREARAASILDHPNICTIHEIGETGDEQMFIVMAYCSGQSLRSRLEGKALEVHEAVDVAAKVAAGLDHAHRHGVIHRDIKPANIMVGEHGSVKIVDFGLARFSQEETAALTNADVIVGTIAYMSPEQIEGRKVDHRADIWGWGVVLYEMLCGRRPFSGGAGMTIIEEILRKAPSRPGSLRPVPGALEDTILQALQKDAGHRQQSAQQLVDQLQRFCSGSQVSLRPELSAVMDSVAVLPFANVGSEPDSDYFSDGLTEEIIDALSRLPRLRVVARTSAFEFKGKPQDVRMIAQQLRVRTIVEGSVRRSGSRLRVSSHLVNADDGYCLWSQKFDSRAHDVFAIQDKIARSIAHALKIRLDDAGGSTSRKQPEKFQAYELYLRGRHQWNKRGGEGLLHALQYFESALQHDRNYAPAYSGIADFHIAVASWGLERPAEAWPKAKEAAVRALELDPDLPEAHASLGTINMWYDWDWAAAEKEFCRAISLNPGHPNGHIQYNLLLVQRGRLKEAEEQVRTVLASDPLSVRANSYLAGVFHYRREYDRSLDQCRRTLELDPEDIELHVVLALNYEQKRMYREAIAELEKARVLSGNNPLILGPLGSCYAGCGEVQESQKILNELEQMSSSMYVAAITRAMVYLGMKDADSAFAWLGTAAQAREILVCYLAVGPIYDFIRADSRYYEMMERIGLLSGNNAILSRRAA